MPNGPEKKKSQIGAPLPSARPPKKSVAFKPPEKGLPLEEVVYTRGPQEIKDARERWIEFERAATASGFSFEDARDAWIKHEREALLKEPEIPPLSPRVPASYPPTRPPAGGPLALMPPPTPPPLQPVAAHMTAEQQAEHDRIVREAQEVEKERQRGFFGSVLDPVTPTGFTPRPLFGYYSGIAPPVPAAEGPTFAETMEPLKILDVLGRGIRKLATGLPETQLAAPGEESRLLASIATDMLTDPLVAAGLMKGAVAGLRGIRGMLEDAVSVGLANQDPGVAQMFSRVRPEQLDNLAVEIQQELLEGGFKRVSPQYQRALVRFLSERGSVPIGRAYEGMFPMTPGGMYSQMGRALEAKLPGRLSKEQARQLLSDWVRKGDFKRQELQWSELDDWIGSLPRGTKLTKEDILDHVRKNELDVQVTVRGGDAVSSQYMAYVEGDPEKWSNYREVLIRLPSRSARFEGHFPMHDVVAHFRVVDRVVPDEITGEPRKVLFVEELQSDWHQKGRSRGYISTRQGEQLREARDELRRAQDAFDEVQEEHGYYSLNSAEDEVSNLQNQLDDQSIAVTEARDRVHELERQADEIAETAAEESDQMQLPGIDPGPPERPLHLQEEIDRAYEEIYRLEDRESDLERMHADMEEIYEEMSGAFSEVDDAQAEWRAIERTGMTPEGEPKPPVAPFGKTWPELSFKRMVQMAVDEGYDSLAWSRGSVQADRYNMAKQVHDLEWVKRPEAPADEDLFLRFRLKRDVEDNVMDAWHEKSVPMKGLNDWIGVDLADQVRAGGVSGRFENQELWMGGEKLRFFYDNEMKRTAQKLVKKFGGKVRVGSMGEAYSITPIPADAGDLFRWIDTEIPRLREQDRMLGRQQRTAERFPTRDRQAAIDAQNQLYDARAQIRARLASMRNAKSLQDINRVDNKILQRYMAANPDAPASYKVTDPTGRTRTETFNTLEKAKKGAAPEVWTVDITPKLRQAVTERGFPLYQILLGTTGAAGAAEAMSAHKKEQ